MKQHKLNALQKGNGLFNVVDGNNNLVRAKCTLQDVKDLYSNGVYYSLHYHYL